MSARIVLFGATGYTGTLTAERLVAQGARPVLAGRGEERLRALAERLGGGLEVVQADALRRNSVFAAVGEGDVVVATVGPFAKYGDAAVRAAIAAGATYLDSTGEPQFIRRVFEEFGPPARRAGAALMTAMGYDWVPGSLAGALALEQAGEDAVAVDVGYFWLDGDPLGGMSEGTRESMVGALLGDSHAFRGGRIVRVRGAEEVRRFEVEGRLREGVSVGSAEHFALPAAYPHLQEVGVYLGWFGPLARAVQAGSLATSVAARLPGVRGVLQRAGERIAGLPGAPDPGTTPGGTSHVVGVATNAAREPLAEVHLSGVDGYAFTAGFLAWAAEHAAAHGVEGAGALGPVEAFGLETLREGVEAAGIEVVSGA